ncbi:hypothetical protein SYNPS1DRAFT_29952 [Syncephalis pseudoplumigaleata]|uniref:Uncharacterized protein n=1 Tax=Syncephalis pseudoplumigaleata TaxID=1712513 RepID=A0A4P9YRA9_9FUNG|nr:hypothetical protein SYNPS1DRAFT_32039 [Syncephalis pseudoplumigaleata]RKP23706.1 hypothetical protein SYNPS1DRAFT_30539 [Syncephalis pseudoplumigaleata]RKP24282.1 hypothetical protein SYNPS1DRAFT_29952 [Syncephalis pseudoplumigaleata]|eukprot:RKP22376.1 hypothetical protein SYNPS1DRAFT_32039 [Syncephalis pseudoplumigaleata]
MTAFSTWGLALRQVRGGTPVHAPPSTSSSSSTVRPARRHRNPRDSQHGHRHTIPINNGGEAGGSGHPALEVTMDDNSIGTTASAAAASPGLETIHADHYSTPASPASPSFIETTIAPIRKLTITATIVHSPSLLLFLSYRYHHHAWS